MHARRRYAALCCALMVTSGCASSSKTRQAETTQWESKQSDTKPSERTAPLLEGMGDLHWPITTDAELAQRYISRGSLL